MARPKKPTHLKLVTNTTRSGRENRNEPSPSGSANGRILAAPAHMSAAGKAAWTAMQRRLKNMGVLSSWDATAIEHMCEAYADGREARAVLRNRLAENKAAALVAAASGSTYPGFTLTTYETRSAKDGFMIRAYPEVAQIADADRRLKAWLTEFGMTPAARSKVSTTTPGGGGADATDEWFA